MEDRGPKMAAVSIAFVVIAWLFVSMRIYVRGWMIKALGMDDWLMITTLVFFTLNNVSVLIGISHGTGKHMSLLTADQRTAALKAWWFTEITYILDTCALKIAIGAFLLRVTTKKSHRYIIYSVTVCSTIYTVYFIFLVIFQCLPVSRFWDEVQPGHCIIPTVISDSTYVHSAIVAITDWTLGILPVFIVRNLHMHWRMKISIAALLCFANVGSIATLLRIRYIQQLDATSDFLFEIANLAIWSTVELGIGIIAGSLATYRPLFRFLYSETASFRSGTRRATPTISSGHVGYERTSSAPAPLSQKARRWYGQNQEYEMDENMRRAKNVTGVTSSETPSV